MQSTVTMGRAAGWLGLVGGAALIATGVLTNPSAVAQIENDRCQFEQRMGRRVTPCPTLEAPERTVLLAAGGGAMASGAFFLLLAGILGTLLGIREDAQAAERERAAAATRSASPPPPPGPQHIGDPPAVSIPSRFDMITRHGEAVGGRAWDLMRQAQLRGHRLPEDEAVRNATDAGHG